MRRWKPKRLPSSARESCLYFGGGFVANTAIFSTLPQRGDVIVHDELIHASVHDGARASKAGALSARHNDANDFDAVIRRWRAEGNSGRPWLAVEPLTPWMETSRRSTI